jgi:hypothetical protein
MERGWTEDEIKWRIRTGRLHRLHAGVYGVGHDLRAEYRNLWDRLSLRDLLARYPKKRGSRDLRLALGRIIEEPTGRRRSPLEERFAAFLRRGISATRNPR